MIALMFVEGFDGLDTVPSAFVLMGNFQSQPATTASTDYTVIREQFKSLANVISRYQRLQVGDALQFTLCRCLCPSAFRISWPLLLHRPISG